MIELQEDVVRTDGVQSDEPQTNGVQAIGVAAAAERFSVSTSTIRNWLRTGLLRRSSEGVALASVEQLERESIGRSKLTSRANKSHKAEQTKARREGDYDKSLSESQRNKEGVYYTPSGIIENIYQIFEGEDLSQKRLLDPCCGSGNFLIEALIRGFKVENIFGYEIDPCAARIARRRIYELTGVRCHNIRCGDFLEIASTLERRFDYCITNPPWGRRIAKQQRREVAKRYGGAINDDSSSIFLRAAMGVVAEGGVVSFLVQEALFTVRAYESLRRYIFDFDVVRLVNHGRVFPSLITSALSVTLRKQAASGSILCEVKEGSDTPSTAAAYRSTLRRRESFLCNPHLIFNIWATEAEATLIERLYSLPHITLSGSARWGLGVVTGSNTRYTSTTPKEGFVEVVRGGDILPEEVGRWGAGRIASEHLYINRDISNYQQVAPMDIYNAPEKLIYKFISDRLSFAVDRSQLLTLNSANNLVLDSDFPLTATELAELLNSDLMNRLFRAIFHTRKVLRGDIEALPIFIDQIPKERAFDEKRYVERLNVDFGLNIQ